MEETRYEHNNGRNALKQNNGKRTRYKRNNGSMDFGPTTGTSKCTLYIQYIHYSIQYMVLYIYYICIKYTYNK